jgi:hypothetical protein
VVTGPLRISLLRLLLQAIAIMRLRSYRTLYGGVGDGAALNDGGLNDGGGKDLGLPGSARWRASAGAPVCSRFLNCGHTI